jgi:DNA-binding LacI/PurR family transcriptional regulator
MRPSTARTSLADVAHRCGVGKGTVSRVLNNDPTFSVRPQLREMIRAVALEMNYRPSSVARQLRGKGSGLVSVLMRPTMPPVLYQHLLAIEAEAHRRGLSLMISQTHGDIDHLRHVLNIVAARGSDAIICMDHGPLNSQEGPALMASWPNVVYLDEPNLPESCHVAIDYAGGIRQAVHHLLARGHRRIGLALWDMLYRSTRERREGYQSALAAEQIPFDDQLLWIGKGPGSRAGHGAGVPVDAIIDALVLGQKADAILAQNDEWAVRLNKRLRRRNIRVPDDVAVVGFDNIDIAWAADPELTTVDQQPALVGPAVIDLVTAQIAGKLTPKTRRVTIPTRLVVRESA